MMVTREQILAELDRLQLPDGRGLATADMVRAVAIDGGKYGAGCCYRWGQGALCD